MRVKGVLEACLYVDDLEAAEAFYSRVLGLETFAREEGRHVFFRCGEGMFLVFNPERTRQRTGDAPAHGAYGPGHVAFAVDEADIPAWRERLCQHGVAIETEITWRGGGRSIYFRDPAGNSVEVATPQTWGLGEAG